MIIVFILWVGVVEALSREEKLRFLKSLETDYEFRYAVAGYIGLSEILRRLDTIESHLSDLREGQNRLWENIEKLWMEIKSLREGQDKLWENAEKLWGEVRSLREGQDKLCLEIRDLREGQNRLWENIEKLWIEVKSLREGQDKLWMEIRDLREEQTKLWREVRDLRMDQRRLRSSFESFGEALGATIEHYACGFVKLLLEDMGYPDAGVGKGFLLYEGVVYQVDIFCEDPLVVGEATLYLRDRDSARRELEKLESRVEAAEKVKGRRTVLRILAVGNAPSEVLEYLRDECVKRDIKLAFGRELELIT
jgi:chromosome segregation ATPase